MDMVLILELTKENFEDNQKIIKNMERENMFDPMEKFMKESM